MSMWVALLWFVIIAVLIVAAAMRPAHGKLSRYELFRRADLGDSAARASLRMYQYQSGLLGLLRALQLLLAVVSFFVLSLAVGVGWSFTIFLPVLLLHSVIVRWTPVVRLGRGLYIKLEAYAEQLAARVPWLFWLLKTDQAVASQLQLGSREELTHTIDQAGAHLTDSERHLLLHGLTFEQRTVHEVMTPIDRLVTIDRHELLGPLVLNDLHKTGRHFFPVTNGTAGQIMGILGIDGYLTLDNKRSLTAEKAMTPHVVYVRDTASLRAAIKLFLQSHQHLLVVEDDQGDAVGVVTLHDCLGQLFGR
jgi:CBS domain containing-hemolysin-like protein